MLIHVLSVATFVQYSVVVTDFMAYKAIKCLLPGPLQEKLQILT